MVTAIWASHLVELCKELIKLTSEKTISNKIDFHACLEKMQGLFMDKIMDEEEVEEPSDIEEEADDTFDRLN